MASRPSPPEPIAPGTEGGSTPPAFRRVLVAIDAPSHRPAPARGLLATAGALGPELTVCHVSLRPTSEPGNETDGAPANEEETGILRGLRAQAVEELGDRGRHVPIRILHGDPGQRIVEYADYLGCDLIVLGSSQKSTLARTLRGSVSRFVTSGTRRSVLIVGD